MPEYTYFDYKKNRPVTSEPVIFRTSLSVKWQKRRKKRSRMNHNSYLLTTNVEGKDVQKKQIRNAFKAHPKQARFIIHAKCKPEVLQEIDYIVRFVNFKDKGKECQRKQSQVHFQSQPTNPVYLNNRLIWIDKQFKTYNEVLKFISNETRIPTGLIMIFKNGKLCHCDTNMILQPYDSISTIVKGKGGMKEDDVNMEIPRQIAGARAKRKGSNDLFDETAKAENLTNLNDKTIDDSSKTKAKTDKQLNVCNSSEDALVRPKSISQKVTQECDNSTINSSRKKKKKKKKMKSKDTTEEGNVEDPDGYLNKTEKLVEDIKRKDTTTSRTVERKSDVYYKPTKEDSEADIQKWMHDIVRLKNVKDYDNILALDGETLLDYGPGDYEQFKTDSHLPIGFARKIHFLINNEDRSKEIFSSIQSNWNPQDVTTFIREELGQSWKMIEEFCKSIEEKQVDGFTFMSYNNESDFRNDFPEFSSQGTWLKKIILKRNKLISPSSDKGPCDFIVKSKVLAEDKLPSTSDVKSPTDKELALNFLEEKLFLLPATVPKEDEPSIIECKLKMMFTTMKNRNEYEKMVLFFVLYRDAEMEGNNSKILWNNIGSNLMRWRNEFQHNDKKIFKRGKDKNVILYGDQELKLSNGKVNLRMLMEMNMSEISEVKNVFLLISNSLTSGSNTMFSINLSARLDDPMPYSFYFEPDKTFWRFNPFDLKEGLRFTNLKLDLNDGKVHSSIGLEQVTSFICQQQIRPFGKSTEGLFYESGNVFPACESDGSINERCFEYKLFIKSIDRGLDVAKSKFLKETLRFACGVLNIRKNGTIVFGVEDVNTGNRKHARIVGFDMDQTDLRPILTDSLAEAKRKCFDHENAAKCIGEPHFISVRQTAFPELSQKYVIEVDIRPSSLLCNNLAFKLNRGSYGGMTGDKSDAIEKNFILFVREGSETKKKEGKDETIFKRIELEQFVQSRRSYESEKEKLKEIPPELPIDKLRNMLCDGVDLLDGSIWPILILGKPTDKQKGDQKWMENMKCIRAVHFYCIIDFDNESNRDGICHHYRNLNTCDLPGDKCFKGYSRDIDGFTSSLSDEYKRNLKTQWLFGNGRKDSDSDILRPRVKRTDWTNEYNGIRDAVSYYKEIIPEGREKVIVFLFSNDFDGLIETLQECVARFGWDKITIIITNDQILTTLSELIVSEQKGTALNISSRSVSGIPWNQVASLFYEITDQTDLSLIQIPCSTGGRTTVHTHFIDSLQDIDILSTDIGNKEFKTSDDQEQFKIDQEVKFFKGASVNWYNLKYDHVCKRHCFGRLRRIISNILNQPTANYLETVEINHNPGAGGSTLSRQLLWEFHEEYRCGIIKMLSKDTGKNICQFWEYNEGDNKMPVLILVDDVTKAEIHIEELATNIRKFMITNYESVKRTVCCLLRCNREESTGSLNDNSKECTIDCSSCQNDNATSHRPRDMNGCYKQLLLHRLSKCEKEWFRLKDEYMSKRPQVFTPDHLLSFLLMRSGFAQNIITDIVNRMLRSEKQTLKENDFIGYVALIGHYGNQWNLVERSNIPVECCDWFFDIHCQKGRVKLWEREQPYSEISKIFLITEVNSTNGRKEIRLSHVSAAKDILKTVTNMQKIELSNFVIKFLESNLFNSHSYIGTEELKQKTKYMLSRRLKEEQRDKKTTVYSPLINDILSTEDWKAAAATLEKGLEYLKDHYICQTLARLYSRNQEFEKAIQKAKDSVSLTADRVQQGFCYQTIGIVLRELNDFKYKKIEKHKTFSEEDVFKALESLHDSFENLCKAKSLVKHHGQLNELFIGCDIILTIILSGRFINKTDTNIKRFFDPNAVLPEHEEKRYIIDRCRFLKYYEYGKEFFNLVQQSICFEPVYYSHNPGKLHRLHNRLYSEYPKLLNQFMEMFADDSKEPCVRDARVVDEWHRRKVFLIMGNNYMDLFNKLLKPVVERRMVRQEDSECCIVLDHLHSIQCRTAEDNINILSANFLICELKRFKTDKTTNFKTDTIKDLLQSCDKALESNRTDILSLGYLYTLLLMWPVDDSAESKKFYVHDRFETALRKLSNISSRKRTKFENSLDSDTCDMNTITKSTPQFFLVEEKGLKKVRHRFNFNLYDSLGTLRQSACSRHLKLVKGFVRSSDKGVNYISVTNPVNGDHEIRIHKIRPGINMKSEESVEFYLGFGIAGPIAYNVCVVESQSRETYYYEQENKLR